MPVKNYDCQLQAARELTSSRMAKVKDVMGTQYSANTAELLGYMLLVKPIGELSVLEQ